MPRSQQLFAPVEQLRQRRERAGRDDIDLAGEIADDILDPRRMDRDRQLRSRAPHGAGTRICGHCSRPDRSGRGPAPPGRCRSRARETRRPSRDRASVSASGARSKSWSESAIWRVQTSASVAERDEVLRRLPALAALRPAAPAAPLFHVKQASSAKRAARSSLSTVTSILSDHAAAPALRACAASSVSAAGVMPSIRAACARSAGRCAASFALDLVRQPGDRVEIEIGRQLSASSRR